MFLDSDLVSTWMSSMVKGQWVRSGLTGDRIGGLQHYIYLMSLDLVQKECT